MFIRKTITIAIFAFLLIVPLRANAAVPVVVFGDYLNLIKDIEDNTQFEVSLEKFLFNLFTALSEKEEAFETSFELAKIEKAREDVAKLIKDTLEELKGGTVDNVTKIDGDDIANIAGYLKNKGITVKLATGDTGQDPGCKTGIKLENGDCVLIKKESRIIRNIDDFLYEEPIIKARHYVNCALGTWKQYPFAGTTTRSAEIRDSMRQNFLNLLQRKSKYAMAITTDDREYPLFELTPSTDWYSEDRCNVIMATLGCDPAPVGSADGGPDFGNRNGACRFDLIYDDPSLDKPLSGYDYSEITSDMIEKSQEAKNSRSGVFSAIGLNIDRIIAEYQAIRQAEYISGQGVRSEKYLIGFKDPFYGDVYHYFDTEYVISPAIVLLQKMAAATQAQFDLARQGFKIPDKDTDNFTEEAKDIKNNANNTIGTITWTKPSVADNSLTPPWEDEGDYVRVGGELPLKDWYEDVIQMHRKTFPQILEEWFDAEEVIPPGM